MVFRAHMLTVDAVFWVKVSSRELRASAMQSCLG